MLKYSYNISLFFLLSTILFSCKDAGIKEEIESVGEEFNIDSFSAGYSVAFDVALDKLGGDVATRDEQDISDVDLEIYENYLDPEEFRVLFFDSKDRFLFESKTRWFAKTESHGGGSRWRVGVPIFQYLSDGYDEHISTNPDWSVDDIYDWERIAKIMRTEPFKVAILANRPSDIGIPEISDITEKQKQVDKFGINGPFWGAKNSVASYEYPENYSDIIKTVFDLHHCQYDPIYEGKSSNADDCYDFIMDYDENSLPQMGAVSSWLNTNRKREKGQTVNYFYKLPHGQIRDVLTKDNHRVNKNVSDLTLDNNAIADPDQYIPMYGIQRFEPLTTWAKGTTYNLSQQTGSQTGGYDYKHITLLRSVVKLELRIPWYDDNGNEIEVDNTFAQLFGNNFMARCEPMDIWTPTGDIWNDNHMKDCEWLRIREYGLYANAYEEDSKKKLYRERLSWFYGVWEDDNKWILNEHTPKSDFTVPSSPAHPRIFNPITQRLTCVYITDCYLPIEGKYHRWVVYCGEHHISDANVLDDLSDRGIVPFFRIAVKKKNERDEEPEDPNAPGWKIYTIPIADYTEYLGSDNNITNPARLVLKNDLYTKEDKKERSTITSTSYPNNMNSQTAMVVEGIGHIGYYRMVQDKNLDERYRPYPLLRNHHYRLTVSYKDDEEEINVEVMDGEKRIIGGIEFN